MNPKHQEILSALETVEAPSKRKAIDIVARKTGSLRSTVQSLSDGRMAFQKGVPPEMPGVPKKQKTERQTPRTLDQLLASSRWTPDGLRWLNG